MLEQMFTPILTTLEISWLGFNRSQCDHTWANGLPRTDPFNRLYWVRTGEAWTALHGRRYMLRPGALYLIPAHVPASYHCPRSMELDWLHCHAHVLYSVDLFTFLHVPYEIPIVDTAWMDRLWEDFLFRPATTGTSIARDGILRQLLAVFIDQVDVEAQGHLQGMARFREVLGYIEAHLDEQCTLARLAEVANLHPGYFSTLFTQATGKGPIAYVNTRRIERAKRLLQDTTCSLQDVASAVGYCDAYYFSRLFKRHTQLTPGQFRRLPHERYP